MTEDKNAVLAAVQRSPQAVAAGDREAWLSLFSRYHVLEDPVGSRPHVGGLYDCRSGRRGRGPLERFHDAFIAPNRIRFHVAADLVCGLHAVRDLEIEIGMAAGVEVRVPMHLLYELVPEAGELKIQRLAAHWELPAMLGELLRPDPACLRALAGNSLNVLRAQGLPGLAGFGRALFSVGSAGRRQVQALLSALQGGDAEAVARACPGVELADSGQRLGAAEACALLRDLDCPKLLVAGDVVSASLRLMDGRRGVMFCYMARRPLRVDRCALYLEPARG